MSKKAVIFALTRPRVVTFTLIGAGLLLWGAPTMAAVVMFGLAAWRASRVLSHSDLDDRLRLRDDKIKHGIHRMLSAGERAEIFAIDHYSKTLVEMGARPEVARTALTHAWTLIRESGREDATAKLKIYRHNLPPLRESAGRGAEAKQDVAAEIQRELDSIRSVERELSLVG